MSSKKVLLTIGFVLAICGGVFSNAFAAPPVVDPDSIDVVATMDIAGSGAFFNPGDSLEVTLKVSVSDAVTSATCDFSEFEGPAAAAMAKVDSVTWRVSYVITAGSTDITSANVSVSATNNDGTTTVADDAAFQIDNQAPVIDPGSISAEVSANHNSVNDPTKAGIGDEIEVAWDKGTNADIDQVWVDFGLKTDNSDSMQASWNGSVYTKKLILGEAGTANFDTVESPNRQFEVVVFDDALNMSSTNSPAMLVDNMNPTITDGKVTGDRGFEGWITHLDQNIKTEIWITEGSSFTKNDMTGDFVEVTNTSGGVNPDTLVSLGGGDYRAEWRTAGSVPYLASLADGSTRNVDVSAMDVAGNELPADNAASAVLDNAPPEITDTYVNGDNSDPRYFNPADSVLLQVEIADQSIGTMEAYADLSQFGLGSEVAADSIDATDAYWMFLPSADLSGPIGFSVWGKDSLENMTSPVMASAIADTTPPVLVSAKIEDTEGYEGWIKSNDNMTITAEFYETGSGLIKQNTAVDLTIFNAAYSDSQTATTLVESGGAPGVWTATWSGFQNSLLGDGTVFNLSFEVQDNVGNYDSFDVDSIGVVDDTDPVVSSLTVVGDAGYEGRITSGDTDITVTAVLTETGSGLDAGDLSLNTGGNLTLNGDPELTDLGGGQWEAVWTGLDANGPASSFSVSVTGQDRVGNNNITGQMAQVITDDDAPVANFDLINSDNLEQINGDYFSGGTTVAFTITDDMDSDGIDNDGDMEVDEVGEGTDWTSIAVHINGVRVAHDHTAGTNVVSVSDTFTEGAYTVEVFYSDLLGNNDNQDFTFYEDLTAPRYDETPVTLRLYSSSGSSSYTYATLTSGDTVRVDEVTKVRVYLEDPDVSEPGDSGSGLDTNPADGDTTDMIVVGPGGALIPGTYTFGSSTYFEIEFDSALGEGDPNGTYAVKVKSLDNIGNEANLETLYFTLDTIGPEMAVTHEAPSDTLSGVVRLSATNVTDTDIDQVTFQYALDDDGDGLMDDAPVWTTITPAVGSESNPDDAAPYEITWDTRGLPWPVNDPTPVSAGFFVRAIGQDDLGNVDDVGDLVSDPSLMLVQIVDQDAPSVAIDEPQHGDDLTGTEHRIYTEIMSPGPGGIYDAKYVQFQYKLYGAASWTDIGTITYPTVDSGDYYFTTVWTLPALQGQYYLRAVATDEAGNTDPDPPQVLVFVNVDTFTPVAMVTSPDEGDRVNDAFNVTASTPTNGDVSEVRFEYMGPGDTTWTEIGTDDTGSPWSVSWDTQYLADGYYKVRAVAKDGNGLEDPSPTYITVYVDYTAPVATVGLTKTVLYPGESYTVYATVDDTVYTKKVTFQYKADGDPSWTTQASDFNAPYALTFDWEDLGVNVPTTIYWRVYATDAVDVGSDNVQGDADRSGTLDANEGQDLAVVSIEYKDYGPSDTDIDTDNGYRYGGDSYLVGLTASPDVSDVLFVTFEYRLKDTDPSLAGDQPGPWVELTNDYDFPYHYTWDVSGFTGQNDYEVAAFVTDQSGQVETPTNFVTLDIDNEAPVTQLILPPDGSRVTGTVTLKAFGDADLYPDLGNTGSERILFQYHDGSDWVNIKEVTNPFGGPGANGDVTYTANDLFDTDGLADGLPVMLRVIAYDDLGNNDPAAAPTISVTVDHTPPANTTIALADPADSMVTPSNDKNVVFVMSTLETDVDWINVYRLTAESGDIDFIEMDGTPPYSITELIDNGYGPGTYYFAACAQDEAGNLEGDQDGSGDINTLDEFNSLDMVKVVVLDSELPVGLITGVTPNGALVWQKVLLGAQVDIDLDDNYNETGADIDQTQSVKFQYSTDQATWTDIGMDQTPYATKQVTFEFDEKTHPEIWTFPRVWISFDGFTTSYAMTRAADGVWTYAAQISGVGEDGSVYNYKIRADQNDNGVADDADLVSTSVTVFPFAATWDVTAVPDGIYYLRALVTDIHGQTNELTAATTMVVVDNTAPTVSIALDDEIHTTVAPGDNVGLHALVPVDIQDVAGVVFQYFDGDSSGSWVTIGIDNSADDWARSWLAVNPLTDGVDNDGDGWVDEDDEAVYTFQLRAVAYDQAQNYGYVLPGSYAMITVDASEPIVRITDPEDGEMVAWGSRADGIDNDNDGEIDEDDEGMITLIAEVPDSVGGAPLPSYVDDPQSVKFQYKLVGAGSYTDIGTDQDGSDGWTFQWDVSSLGENYFVLRAVAADSVGNEQTTLFPITVVLNDATSPSVWMSMVDGRDVNDPNLVVMPKSNIVVKALCNGGADWQEAILQISEDDSTWSNVDQDFVDGDSYVNFTWDATMLAEGTYYLRVLGVDGNSNQYFSEVFEVEVDATKPVADYSSFAPTAPFYVTGGGGDVFMPDDLGNITLRVTADEDVASATLQYREDVTDDWVDFDDYETMTYRIDTGDWTRTMTIDELMYALDDGDGTWHVRVLLVDHAGNSNADTDSGLVLTVDTADPIPPDELYLNDDPNADLSVAPGETVTVSTNAIRDLVTDVEAVYFQYRIDGSWMPIDGDLSTPDVIDPADLTLVNDGTTAPYWVASIDWVVPTNVIGDTQVDFRVWPEDTPGNMDAYAEFDNWLTIQDEEAPSGTRIIQPVAGARVGGDDVTIAAQVQDNAAVAYVDFYVGSSAEAIGRDSDGGDGWTVSWNTLAEDGAGNRKYPDGTHYLWAVATDGSGNTETSPESIMVTVDNTPPYATIGTLPTTIQRDLPTTLTATLSKNVDATVKFYYIKSGAADKGDLSNWTLIGTDATAPYTFDWTPGVDDVNVDYDIMALASDDEIDSNTEQDDAGVAKAIAEGRYETVMITDTVAPVASVWMVGTTQVMDGAVKVNGGTSNVVAKTPVGDQFVSEVQFKYFDGAQWVDIEDAATGSDPDGLGYNNTWTASWNRTGLNGTYLLWAVAKDDQNNADGDSTHAVSVVVDGTVPTATIAMYDDQGGALTSTVERSSIVTMAAYSSDTDVDFVTFYYKLATDLATDGDSWTAADADSNAPYSVDWDNSELLYNKTYDFVALPTDSVGNRLAWTDLTGSMSIDSLLAHGMAVRLKVVDTDAVAKIVSICDRSSCADIHLTGEPVSLVAESDTDVWRLAFMYRAAAGDTTWHTIDLLTEPDSTLQGAEEDSALSWSLIWTAYALPEGNYFLSVVATDGVGNISSPETNKIPFVIDRSVNVSVTDNWPKTSAVIGGVGPDDVGVQFGEGSDTDLGHVYMQYKRCADPDLEGSWMTAGIDSTDGGTGQWILAWRADLAGPDSTELDGLFDFRVKVVDNACPEPNVAYINYANGVLIDNLAASTEVISINGDDTPEDTDVSENASVPIVAFARDDSSALGADSTYNSGVAYVQFQLADTALVTETPSAVDIVWIVDASGSMSDEQMTIGAQVTAFTQALGGADYRLAVAAFESKGSGMFDNNQYVWDSAPMTAGGSYGTPGGGTGLWTTDFSTFNTMVTNVGTWGGTENGCGALIEALQHYSFRPGAAKAFILITDECGDDNNRVTEAITAMQNAGATVFAVIDPSCNTYTQIAAATNGQVFDISGNFGAQISVIGGAVGELAAGKGWRDIGVLKGTSPDGLYSILWNTTGLTAGEDYFIRTVVTDNVGNRSVSQAVRVLITDHTAPIATISGYYDGEEKDLIFASTSDRDVAEVQIQARAMSSTVWTNIGIASQVVADDPGPGLWVTDWQTESLADGAYLIRAIAKDTSGNKDTTQVNVPSTRVTISSGNLIPFNYDLISSLSFEANLLSNGEALVNIVSPIGPPTVIYVAEDSEGNLDVGTVEVLPEVDHVGYYTGSVDMYGAFGGGTVSVVASVTSGTTTDVETNGITIAWVDAEVGTNGIVTGYDGTEVMVPNGTLGGDNSLIILPMEPTFYSVTQPEIKPIPTTAGYVDLITFSSSVGYFLNGNYATVKLHYDPAQVTGSEENLSVAYWTGSSWSFSGIIFPPYVEGVNTDANTVEFATSHLDAVFAVVGVSSGPTSGTLQVTFNDPDPYAAGYTSTTPTLTAYLTDFLGNQRVDCETIEMYLDGVRVYTPEIGFADGYESAVAYGYSECPWDAVSGLTGFQVNYPELTAGTHIFKIIAENVVHNRIAKTYAFEVYEPSGAAGTVRNVIILDQVTTNSIEYTPCAPTIKALIFDPFQELCASECSEQVNVKIDGIKYADVTLTRANFLSPLAAETQGDELKLKTDKKGDASQVAGGSEPYGWQMSYVHPDSMCLSNGTHTFTISVTEQNVTYTTAVDSFTVDALPPVADFIGVEANNQTYIGEVSPTIQVTASDEGAGVDLRSLYADLYRVTRADDVGRSDSIYSDHASEIKEYLYTATYTMFDSTLSFHPNIDMRDGDVLEVILYGGRYREATELDDDYPYDRYYESGIRDLVGNEAGAVTKRFTVDAQAPFVEAFGSVAGTGVASGAVAQFLIKDFSSQSREIVGVGVDVRSIQVKENGLALRMGSEFDYDSETGILTVKKAGSRDGVLTISVADRVGNKTEGFEYKLRPRSYALSQNYPNPFNPVTAISYQLPFESAVRVTVFDVSGRKVRTLVDSPSLKPGYYVAVWDGRNDAGKPVASGVYFYRMDAAAESGAKFMKAKKMLLMK